MPSISTLEKSVERIANKLRLRGYTVEVSSFAVGRGGDAFYGTGSQVEISAEMEEDEAKGIEWDCHDFTFQANGYGGMGKHEAGGTSFKKMKAHFNAVTGLNV